MEFTSYHLLKAPPTKASLLGLTSSACELGGLDGDITSSSHSREFASQLLLSP